MLNPETHYEYYFKNASIYYCEKHDCLRVVNDHEDSVMMNGITQENIDEFIEFYNKYVKKVPDPTYIKVVEDAN